MDGCKNVWGLYKQSKYKILEDFGTIDVQRFLWFCSSLKELGAQIPLKPSLASIYGHSHSPVKFEKIVFLG